jgi:hypothetical protein
MRTRRRAERGTDSPPEYGGGKPLFVRRHKKMAAGNPKDGVAGFELSKNPRKQLLRGYWPE